MAERRAESYAWDEEEEAVRVHIVQQLGPALAAQVSDTMMMRFIRGYYYEEPRAENTLAILRETLQWRQRTGVESMIDEPDEMLLRQSMTYRNLFHLDIYGRDSTGHVIMCQVSAPPVHLPAPAAALGVATCPSPPLVPQQKRSRCPRWVRAQEIGRIEPRQLLDGLSMTAIKRNFIRDIEYLCAAHCIARPCLPVLPRIAPSS
jgi:hypothetical protein